MGMAASQARLLTITARLSDNELRSQTINNAKMRLAAQSSQASEDYINALNRATLKFSNYDEVGGAVNQALTFNALTAYSSYNTQYGLVNAAGQLLVSEAEANIFANSGNNINNYLKAHGLEYKTTYFENLGALENVSYPTPFNSISVEDLNKYYEAYNSYETSVEVDRFQSSYSTYNKQTNNLKKAGAYVMKQYLLANQTFLSEENGSFIAKKDSSGNSTATYNEIKTAFTSGPNKYNINTLYSDGFISKSTLDDINELFSNISVTASGDLKVTSSATITSKPDDTDPKKTVYTLDEDFKITVDENGNVIAIDYTDLASEINKTNDDGTSGSFTYSGLPADGTHSLEDFINGLKYTEEDRDSGNAVTGTHDYYYHVDNVTQGGEYTVSSYTFTSGNDERRAALDDIVDYVMYSILYDADYEKFAEYIMNLNDTARRAIGIDTEEQIPTVGNQKLGDILKAYEDAKNEFFKNIFDEASLEQVFKDMADHTLITLKDAEGNEIEQREVNIDNIQDIEFLLQYISQTEGVNQSDNFNTIIKKYIMDNIIELNGTPKYAWVDSNDTGNTGNADAKAQWYTNLFTRMQKGYKALENGLASSKEWIEYALESGIVTMEQVDKSFNWKSLDYKTCTRITEETDDAAVARAEAEYNRAMNDIKAKDNIYDLQLKNIDTEHNSLQTEYDVIKGVINKNIERTFKFNQSA